MNTFLRPLARLCALAVCVALAPALAHEPNEHKVQASGFGQPAAAAKVTRTVMVTMLDSMRFDPASLRVQRGETLRLRIHNAGKLEHEFVLGTAADIEEHAEMMRRMPEMRHTDASAVRVAPGASADIVWQFSQDGRFVFACLLPGHREAGMQGLVQVSAPATASAKPRVVKS